MWVNGASVCGRVCVGVWTVCVYECEYKCQFKDITGYLLKEIKDYEVKLY